MLAFANHEPPNESGVVSQGAVEKFVLAGLMEPFHGGVIVLNGSLGSPKWETVIFLLQILGRVTYWRQQHQRPTS